MLFYFAIKKLVLWGSINLLFLLEFCTTLLRKVAYCYLVAKTGTVWYSQIVYLFRNCTVESCDWTALLDAGHVAFRSPRRWYFPFNETLPIPWRSPHLSCWSTHVEFLVSFLFFSFFYMFKNTSETICNK